MVASKDPASRKRPRCHSPHDSDNRESKRLKVVPEDPPSFGNHRVRRPPGYWNTLSRIQLTRGALREFDLRIEEDRSRSRRQEKNLWHCTPTPNVEDLDRSTQKLLKQFATRGGPDLTELRGTPLILPIPAPMMSNSVGSRAQKLAANPSPEEDGSKTKTSKTTTYSANFEQKIKDIGIFFTNKASKPENLQEIKEYQTRRRESLSSSQFNDDEFEEFKELCQNTSGEPKAMHKAMSILAGKSDNKHLTEEDRLFNHLKAFDDDLSFPKPDVYYGSSPSMIDKKVRSDIGLFITPCTEKSRPAAPDFFVEVKGSTGRMDVATRQACYDGATGARAMLHLQSYGADEPIYDHNAYSFTSIYNAGTRTLHLYATHPTEPTPQSEGRTEYHWTEIRGYFLTNDRDSFVEAAMAYRNTRDLAKMYRETFITNANQVAHQRRTSASSTTMREDDTHQNQDLHAIASDTCG